MEDLKKKMVDLELHSGLNKDMMLLTNEQKRQDGVLQKVSTMLHDLIRVNLQREIPADDQTEQLDLQSQQYLFPIVNCACPSDENCIHKMLQSHKIDLQSKDLQDFTTQLLSNQESKDKEMMDDDDLARARSQNNQNDYNDRVKTAGESPT